MNTQPTEQEIAQLALETAHVMGRVNGILKFAEESTVPAHVKHAFAITPPQWAACGYDLERAGKLIRG